jgi:hypothetical protein
MLLVLLLSFACLPAILAAGQPEGGDSANSDSLSAADVSKPLSLEECLDIALRKSHRRPASQFAVAMAEAQHRQALAGYWPQVNFQGGYQRLGEPANFLFPASSVQIPAQSITVPGGMAMVTIPAGAFGPGFPVVTKNLVHTESIDVGAVPLVSSHSYVQSVGFRLYRPRFLLPGAGRFAIGEPRPAPSDQCAAEVAAWACSPEGSGPPLPDVAFAPLVRLALCPRHRQAGYGDCLASQGIPVLLDLEEPPRAVWETRVGERDSRVHPQDELGEPALESTAYPWGTA